MDEPKRGRPSGGRNKPKTEAEARAEIDRTFADLTLEEQALQIIEYRAWLKGLEECHFWKRKFSPESA